MALAASQPAPRLSVARLLAGVFAGLVGGLAFGVLMAAPAVAEGGSFNGMGMLTLVSRVLGTESLGVLWSVHLLNSALFGLVFALLVAPRRAGRTVLLAMGWSFLLWLVGAFVLLRTLAGESLRLDAAAVFNLAGHLAYGIALGLAYGAFHREEVVLLHDHPEIGRRRASSKP